MAEQPTFSSAPIKITTTTPSELVAHWISDEQLEMLSVSRRDGLSEAFWAAFGVFAGTISQTVVAIYASYSPEPNVPMPALDMVQALLCVGSLVALVVIQLISSVRGKSTKDLVAEIRNRKLAG
jgi:hypothetical protein